MAWVKSEYAGELAVVSAWLSMVLPWNVVYHPSVPTQPLESTITIVRLSLFELQFRAPVVIEIDGRRTSPDGVMDQLYPGINVLADVYVATPLGAVSTYDGFMQLGSVAWLVAAGALLVAFAVSIALYRDEEGFTERSSVDPVRLVGGLLGAAAVAGATASAFYFLGRDLGGIPIPVGVLIIGALSVALLRVDRT
jgi:hypothetical protein